MLQRTCKQQKRDVLNPKRSLGFVKLRAFAWQIALHTAEGVAGYDEAAREGR